MAVPHEQSPSCLASAIGWDEPWRAALDASEPAMCRLLRQVIAQPSVSGQEGGLAQFIAQWARAAGFEVDCWLSSEAQLAAWPEARQRHLPLAGRPTVVIRLPGRGGGASLIFNAHSDVVAAGDPQGWSHGPWSGDEVDGRIYGRGACDVKGPLVSALWAMRLLSQHPLRHSGGDVLLELVPGEEDCVGLGTLTSVARGWRATGAIVLEPTENVPCLASRGGCRFEVACRGRAVHGTVKWLGVDAIQCLRRVLEALGRLEARWNDRVADPLFSVYPIARPVTVDRVEGGQWQGMICDCCRCAGYLELLPGDELEAWKRRFDAELRAEVGALEAGGALEISFGEAYRGHRLGPEEPLGQLAGKVSEIFQVASAAVGPFPMAFNAGCEAGVRAGLLGTPTLVWGPGSLVQAHAVDEFIEFCEVRRAAAMFAEFATRWTAIKGEPPCNHISNT